MLNCCVCKLGIDCPENLFKHLKNVHKIKGNDCQVQCTIGKCAQKFTDFSRFKRHVLLTCLPKVSSNEEAFQNIADPDLYVYSINEDVLLFQGAISTAALEMVCTLCGNMSWARAEIFTTITQFKTKYISRELTGIKEIIIPRVRPEEEETVNDFIKAIESSFGDVETESKLDTTLHSRHLMEDIQKCEIFETVEKKKKKPRRKKRKQGKDFEADGPKLRKRTNTEDSDDNDGDNEEEEDEITEDFEADGPKLRKRTNTEDSDDNDGDNEEEEDEITECLLDEDYIMKKGKVSIMPIHFQIKKFFELPNVFEKVRLNTARLKEGNDLDHFIKGKLWKKKVAHYKPDQIVIPFHFYGDGAQMNNPLGSHAKPGEQQLNYYSFPTIPYEYQSRLKNIFLAQSYPAKYHQEFSVEQLYNNIIDIFATLAEDGIILNINGEEIQVFFVCGIFIGDSKEQNQRLGFVGSFTGIHCCRYCKMDINEIRTSVNSVGATRRNRENYDDDVATDNVTATGVQEDSVFNRIPFFHVTDSSGVDLSHDLTEGTLHTSLRNSILDLINKGRFDLETLNKRMTTMDFGEAEKGDMPSPITMESLKSNKLKMSASEMFFFAQNFTLMIGDLVPRDDPTWHHVLSTIKFFDLCFLPSYNQDSLNALFYEGENFNKGLKNLFGLNFQHKAHLGCHYKDLTEEYGPLRYVKTIRFEGKHRIMKGYSKNTNNRLNLGFSLGKKVQYDFALRLLEHDGLEDQIDIPKYTFSSIRNKVYYTRLTASTQLDQIILSECYFANKVIVNGIIFSSELWLPNFEDSKISIHEIVDAVILELNNINKIFVVCKSYTSVNYVEHYAAYHVDMNSLQDKLTLININEFLLKHHYPVKIHQIENLNLFRCRRF